MPNLCRRLRSICASGHIRVCEMSATRTAVASSLAPAPIDDTSGSPRFRQYWIRHILGDSVSIASTRKSSSKPSRSAGIFSSVMYSGIVTRSSSGLMSRSLLRRTSHLGRPTVDERARIWRLRLVSDTSSESTATRWPTPARASASAAKPPTPPTPITATRAPRSLAAPSAPRSISVLSCQLSITTAKVQKYLGVSTFCPAMYQSDYQGIS